MPSGLSSPPPPQESRGSGPRIPLRAGIRGSNPAPAQPRIESRPGALRYRSPFILFSFCSAATRQRWIWRE
uniref:Uncharacterized protein n=1 Tax=Arundo donax TaxID=35708 RepID=A0A0A9EXT9_ARUDO